jgi:hypothetical protein
LQLEAESAKRKAIAVKDQKNKDVKSSSKKKNFWHTFSVGVRKDYKFLKECHKKESHNPVFTFFKSMAQIVTQFPPSITTETRVKICQLVVQMEAKALHEQNHDFSSSTDYQVPCYSCHCNVPPAPC